MNDALAQARGVQLAASGLGFDWPDVSGALAKLREEVDEFGRAIEAGFAESQRIELGDVLFSAVNVSRFIDVDAAEALRATTDKFEARFGRVREKIRQTGRAIEACSIDELDALWEGVKQEEQDRGINAS